MPFVVLAVMLAAIGGSLFGYDTGVISGAILFVKPEFALGTAQEELVVSAALIGATVGAIASGRLTDMFGRRAVLLGAAVSFAAGAIGSALAPAAGMLIAARLLVGAAIGVTSYAVPLYISELAPPRWRGWLVSLNQLAITVGILLAYVVDYAFAASGAWRWMLGVAVIPAVLLALTFQAPTPASSVAGLSVACLMVFVGSFAIGLGPIFWLLIAEIYPSRVRGLAMSVATTANWGSNLVASLTFLTLVEALGPANTFWFYGLIAVTAWYFAFRLVPETRGRTLEEIESFWDHIPRHTRDQPGSRAA
jgi:MFS family permease